MLLCTRRHSQLDSNLKIGRVISHTYDGATGFSRRLSTSKPGSIGFAIMRFVALLTEYISFAIALRVLANLPRRHFGKKSEHKRGKPSKISDPPIRRKAATMAAIQLQSEVVVKPKHPYSAAAVWSVLFFGFATSMCAQQVPTRTHIGAPQDWSDRHIVFSRGALAQHPELIYREPRIFNQARQRWRTPNSAEFHGANPFQVFADKSAKHRDWSVDLAGRLDANMFPAKYSFNPDAASCSGDYVVFGLATSGTGVANLVAFTNLYVNSGGTGLCTGLMAPTVLFAYNITTATGGKIVTSPIISEDGTQIAFVESVGGSSPQSIFHVLTWSPGGSIDAPVIPTSTSMTSLTYSLADNISSSPWIDYGTGTVYVGDDSGLVYQITGVFNGTPTPSGGNWPITVSSGQHLTSPVLDSNLGLLMVGSSNGNLYQINTAAGTLGAPLPIGLTGGTTPGIVAPPIVDVTNGTSFVVTANDGISAALVEVKTSTMTQFSAAEIGQGSKGGATTPPVKLYEPAFSNAYYNDPASGEITLCGTGTSDTTPYQYAFGFIATKMIEDPPSIKQQLSTTATDRCTSGWTEFFNPDIGAGGTDFFFFGLSSDCTKLSGGVTDGCVVAISVNGTTGTTTTAAAVTGGTSGIIVDNYSEANIYFAGGMVNTAYQFPEDGLQ